MPRLVHHSVNVSLCAHCAVQSELSIKRFRPSLLINIASRQLMNERRGKTPAKLTDDSETDLGDWSGGESGLVCSAVQ